MGGACGVSTSMRPVARIESEARNVSPATTFSSTCEFLSTTLSDIFTNAPTQVVLIYVGNTTIIIREVEMYAVLSSPVSPQRHVAPYTLFVLYETVWLGAERSRQLHGCEALDHESPLIIV